MHFRVLDLAAERCVWSVPPIDVVPLKLRGEKLVRTCRCIADFPARFDGSEAIGR